MCTAWVAPVELDKKAAAVFVTAFWDFCRDFRWFEDGVCVCGAAFSPKAKQKATLGVAWTLLTSEDGTAARSIDT